MQYEWHASKNQLNIKKHGLSFENAAMVFENRHITTADDRFEYGENRYITTGTLGPYGRQVVIAHTHRGDRIRLISMRKANIREQRKYATAIGGYNE